MPKNRPARIKPVLVLALGAFLAPLLLAGCLQAGASWEWGWSTTALDGQVGLLPPPTESETTSPREVVGSQGTPGGAKPPQKGQALVVAFFVENTLATVDSATSTRATQTQDNSTALTTRSARVVPVDARGRFHLPLPPQVTQVELLMVALGHQTQRFSFQRQLGVGAVHYQAQLPYSTDWRGHFKTFVEPLLTPLITDPAWGVPPEGRSILADWLRTGDDQARR